MNTPGRKFTATEESTSKHPQDWGRAMAVAICRLGDMAREAGDDFEHEALLGEDLHLFVKETHDGVNITMSWTPKREAQKERAGEPAQPAG